MSKDEFDLEHEQTQEIDDCKNVKKYQQEDDEFLNKQLTDLDSRIKFGKTNEQTENINIQMKKKESNRKVKIVHIKNLDRVSKNSLEPGVIAKQNPNQIDGVSDSEGSQQQQKTSKAVDLQNLMKDLKDYKATRNLYGGVLRKLEESDSESSVPSEIPIEGNETWQDFDADNDSINLFDDVEIGEVAHFEGNDDEELVKGELVEDPRGPGYEYSESASTETISNLLEDDLQKDRRRTIFWTVFLFFSCLVIISSITIPTVITNQNAGRKKSKIEAPEHVEHQSVKEEQSPEKIAKTQQKKPQEPVTPNKDEIMDAAISENHPPDNLQQHQNTPFDRSQENNKMMAVPQNRKFMSKVVKKIVLVAAIIIVVVLAFQTFDLGKMLGPSMRTMAVVRESVGPVIDEGAGIAVRKAVGDGVGTAGDNAAAMQSRFTPKNIFEKIRKIQICNAINKDAEMCMNQVLKKKM